MHTNKTKPTPTKQRPQGQGAEPHMTAAPVEAAKLLELTNDLKRTRADFENFRRIADQQKAQYGALVLKNTVAKLLPLLDDLDRAFTAHPKELSPLQTNFAKTLASLNLSVLPLKKGDKFNPDEHEAVSVQGEGEQEVIQQVLRPGYLYEGKLIRPAMVAVIKK